jgi:hypothetical protein
MTPSQPAYTKTQPQTGGSYYILNEKWPKTTLFRIKPLPRYNFDTFCEV